MNRLLKSPIIRFPAYAKLTFILLSLGLITLILYLGQKIIFPLLLSLLFAILLRPLVVLFHEKMKLPHIIAVLISVVLFVIFFTAVIVFVSWQVSNITDDWKIIKFNLTNHYEHIQHWIMQRYDLSYNKQQTYISRVTEKVLNSDSELMGNTLSSFTNTLFIFTLIPIYTFLILLYRTLFIEFLHKLVEKKDKHILTATLNKIKKVVQSYIAGLLIEVSIVSILTTTGLMLIGVEYAVLLGVITALFNLIPYIGILTAAGISVLVTLSSSNELSMVFGVLAVNIVVQLIDNNIIVPRVVGNHVRINALASIMGVIVGGFIAGVPGMFLSIPFIAIIKVIFDHIESLKPWGHLLGNTLPLSHENIFIKEKIKS